jgi:uncharacterized membrane protein (UPF0127 family)
MAWLVRDERVLATLELAETGRARRRGLLGRDGIDGALLLRPARAVHTVGMRFALDVAYCDADLKVLKVRRMARHRVGLPVPAARAVLEAEAGAFASWDLKVGDELEVRGDRPDGEAGSGSEASP